MGQRSTTLLYDATSAAAGAIDSGVLKTEGYDSILIHLVAAGAAAPASASASAVLEDGTLASLGTVTLPAIAGTATTALVWTSPRKARFQATGGAGSTVRMAVYGVRG